MTQKKGILLVHYGTARDGARASTVDVLEEEVRAAWPHARVITAFSSDRMRAALEKRGIFYPDPASALEEMKDRGVRHLAVLTTHLLQGVEYEKTVHQLSEAAADFDVLRCSRPLLSVGQTKEVASVFSAVHPSRPRQLLLLVGHGTRLDGNAVYRELETALRQMGRSARVATLTDLDDAGALPDLPPPETADILLLPLLYTAGGHVTSDLIEKEDSWKHTLERQGYRVDAVSRGIGEYDAFRTLYRKKLAEFL